MHAIRVRITLDICNKHVCQLFFLMSPMRVVLRATQGHWLMACVSFFLWILKKLKSKLQILISYFQYLLYYLNDNKYRKKNSCRFCCVPLRPTFQAIVKYCFPLKALKFFIKVMILVYCCCTSALEQWLNRSICWLLKSCEWALRAWTVELVTPLPATT